jgi:hypothetical protein
MEKLLILILTTVGGYLGWWLGEPVGFMTAFMLSIVGSGLGLYVSRRIVRDYL